MTQQIVRLVVVFVFLLLPRIANSADRPGQLQSPYFVVHGPAGADSAVDSLPLKETKAKVEIAGVIASVVVTQTYTNEGTVPIEATYVFPGSTRAAVMAMEMQVGERKIKAKIETRKKAAKIYKKALAAGKTASLLEQEKPNVFKMKIANIMPKDTVVVRIEYVEALIPESGIYEFVYPTVVGPRYTGEDASRAPASAWTSNPHTRAGRPASYQWDLSATLRSGIPIRALYSDTHILQTRFLGPKVAQVDVNDKRGGNRDFVLRYRLTGKAIETGVLLFPGNGKSKEKFFLAMVQPPSMQSKVELPAREYIFIVDVSGSMHGFPMKTTRSLMTEIFKGLKPKDRLNLMKFAGGSDVLAPVSLPATQANKAKALAALGSPASGGTHILKALQQALAMKRNSDMATTFVVVTDGYVSVESEAFGLIRKNLGKANLFSFGIGSSVNRHLVEGMARAGRGKSFVTLKATEARGKAKAFASYISSPVLTNVKLQIDGFDAYDLVPSKLPDVFSQRPLLVFGKYRGNKNGRIVFSGVTGTGSRKMVIDVAGSGAESVSNGALRYLWARDRIAELEDDAAFAGKNNDQKITNRGLKYNLMTAYTSFVAVDDRLRNRGSKSATKVRQALPMPAGVSNAAIEGEVYGGVLGSKQGGYGYGLSGLGSGGGGVGWGTVGTGSYGTIGRGSGSGTGYGRTGRQKGPKVTIGKATVRGDLDRNIIRRYIRRKLPLIRHCYATELVSNPKLTGKIVLKFAIGPDGKVPLVTVTGLSNPAFQSCIGRAIKSISFPRPPGGTIRVVYPFRLSL